MDWIGANVAQLRSAANLVVPAIEPAVLGQAPDQNATIQSECLLFCGSPATGSSSASKAESLRTSTLNEATVTPTMAEHCLARAFKGLRSSEIFEFMEIVRTRKPLFQDRWDEYLIRQI